MPNLDQARKVLDDFTIFWNAETDPDAKREFLSLTFDGVWLDEDRIVAVQPKPSFAAFFQQKRRNQPTEKAGVKSGSDGVKPANGTPHIEIWE